MKKTFNIIWNRLQLQEEIPVNSAGSGNIDGIGVGPDGEPGISKPVSNKYKKSNKKEQETVNNSIIRLVRRNVMEDMDNTINGVFAGHPTFIVSSDTYHRARLSKQKGAHWSKYLNNKETDHIRRYANSKPTKPVIVQDKNTGALFYARYGKR